MQAAHPWRWVMAGSLVAGAAVALIATAARWTNAIGGSAVKSGPMAGEDGEKVPLTFDLSGARDLAAVGWPEGARDEEFWFPQGPRLVTVLLPGGRRDRYFIDKAILSRVGDRVTGIALQFPNEAVEEVYCRSAALAKLWDLRDPEKLDEWRDQRLKDGGNTPDSTSVFVFNDRSIPAVRLQVYRAYIVGEPPWWVQLSFGFAKAASSKPTGPGTLPAGGAEVQ